MLTVSAAPGICCGDQFNGLLKLPSPALPVQVMFAITLSPLAYVRMQIYSHPSSRTFVRATAIAGPAAMPNPTAGVVRRQPPLGLWDG